MIDYQTSALGRNPKLEDFNTFLQILVDKGSFLHVVVRVLGLAVACGRENAANEVWCLERLQAWWISPPVIQFLWGMKAIIG